MMMVKTYFLRQFICLTTSNSQKSANVSIQALARQRKTQCRTMRMSIQVEFLMFQFILARLLQKTGDLSSQLKFSRVFSYLNQI